MNYTATQGLFTFNGRRGRLSFLGAACLQMLVGLFGVLALLSIGLPLAFVGDGVLVNIISLPVIGLMIWIDVNISFQRMRDMGFVNNISMVLMFLAMFIPVVGAFLALGLFLVKGK